MVHFFSFMRKVSSTFLIKVNGKYIIHRLGNQLYLNLLVCLFGWESILFLYQVVAWKPHLGEEPNLLETHIWYLNETTKNFFLKLFSKNTWKKLLIGMIKIFFVALLVTTFIAK